MELYHHNRQEVVKANGSSSREESDLRRKQINEFQRESKRVTVPESALEIFVRVNGIEPRWSRYLDGFLGEWASEIHENKVNAALSRLGFPNLPSFSGVNPYDWVKICEEFFDINPSLEVCKESLVADLLIGKAKAWYWSWCVGNEEADWDEFVDNLCEHFGNKEQLDNVESSVVKKLSDFEDESQVGLKEETDLGCRVNEQEVAFDGVLLVKSNSCILVEGLCEIEAVANKESDLEKHDVLEGESNKEFVENFSECERENQDGFEENFCDSRLESRVRWDRFEEVHGKEDDSVKLWSSNEMGEYGQYRGRPPDSFSGKSHNDVDGSGLVRHEVIKKICPEVESGCKDQVLMPTQALGWLSLVEPKYRHLVEAFCEFGRENQMGMKNDTNGECDVTKLVIQAVIMKVAIGSNSSLDIDVDFEYFNVKSKLPHKFGATKEPKLSCLGGDNLVIVLEILETFKAVTIAAGSTFQLGSGSSSLDGGNDVFDALRFATVDKEDKLFKLLVEKLDALIDTNNELDSEIALKKSVLVMLANDSNNGDELEKVEITGISMNEPGYVIESGRSFETNLSSRRCVSNGMVVVDINSEMMLSISSSSLYELTRITIRVYDPGKWVKRIVKLGMDLSAANLKFYAFLQVFAFRIWDPGDLDITNKVRELSLMVGSTLELQSDVWSLLQPINGEFSGECAYFVADGELFLGDIQTQNQLKKSLEEIGRTFITCGVVELQGDLLLHESWDPGGFEAVIGNNIEKLHSEVDHNLHNSSVGGVLDDDLLSLLQKHGLQIFGKWQEVATSSTSSRAENFVVPYSILVAFLQTYMKLHPSCKPVIIAPTNMLQTWESEFSKWQVEVPFLNLNDPKLVGNDHKGTRLLGV